jgi:hypothetical protein
VFWGGNYLSRLELFMMKCECPLRIEELFTCCGADILNLIDFMNTERKLLSSWLKQDGIFLQKYFGRLSAVNVDQLQAEFDMYEYLQG